MRIEFYKVSACSKTLIRSVAEAACQFLRQPQELQFSLSFLTEKQIQAINKKFRNKDCPTDVLSFPMLENPEKGPLRIKDYPNDIDPETRHMMLGDILICPAVAKRQAEEYGHTSEREIAFLALHGLLHLFGYNHEEAEEEEEMTALQQQILLNCQMPRS